MRRFVGVVFLAAVLLSCGGGGARRRSEPQLRNSGFQTISSDQEYLDALKTLGNTVMRADYRYLLPKLFLPFGTPPSRSTASSL